MRYLLMFAICLLATTMIAQPVNDDCAGAINIPNIVADCIAPGVFTNVGATETTGFGTPSNCTPPWSGGQRDVWFTFTTTLIVDVSLCVNGLTMTQPQLAVYRGDCTGLVELICGQAGIGENLIELDVLGLDPFETYFIRINDYSATGTPNEGTFEFCIKEYDAPDVIEDITVTTCSGTIFDTGDATGQYMNNENINFTICPSDPHGCIVLDIPFYDIENGFDNLFIHNGPDNTTPPIFAVTGNGTNLNIPVPTTGCVTLNFVSDGSVTADGFEVSWQCSPGACPLPPPDIMACTGMFFDSGGAGGDYANNENDVTIICPDDPTQCVTLGFTTFEVENFFDNLTILDGAGQFSPTIGTFTGTNSPGTVTATTDGCLTVIFTSDGSVTDPGWSANIVCNTCGLAPPCTGADPMCQGIPDDCFSACDLGTIATPGLCPGAAPIIDVYCISNVGATPSSPYNSQTGCAGGSDQANPAADVWYTFVASTNSMNITLQSNLTAANLALYQGSDCNTLLNVDCAVSTNGTVSLNSNSITPGETYFIQVSGADAQDQADDMTLELESIKDCDACNISSTLVVTPQPTNGFYAPGETITFCYTVTEWNQSSANWIHALVPSFSTGWDVSTLMPVSAPPSCDGNGDWDWYTSFTGTNSGMTFGPGFAYDSNAGGPFDDDPGNNFGDNCQGAVNFEFCFSIQIASPFPAGVTQVSVDIETYGDSETGSWGSEDCENDPVFLFAINIDDCTQPSIAVTSVDADCGAGTLGSIDLIATGQGPFSYQWSDPAIGDVASASNLPPGTYTIIIDDLGEECPAQVTVDILEVGALAPSTVLVSNVLCGTGVGSAEALNSNGTAPYTFFWDNGETTAIATGLSVGPHTVNVVDANGCAGFASVDIGFDTEALMLAASTAADTICLGESVLLTVSGASAYNWSPGDGLSSITSSNPTASPSQTTTYTVTGSVIGPNLVVNGNFESGNTGFTTDYGPPQGGAFGPLSVPGTYEINTSPLNTHINFANCQDNSNVGIGQMLVANGSQNLGDNIWCQTVMVEPGSDYVYSAFAASVVPGSPANLQLLIDGTPVSTLQLPTTTCDWTFFSSNFNSGASTQVDLCITNLETTDGGNDFALDDIQFRPVCQGTETVTVFVSDLDANIFSSTNEICGGDGMGSAEALGINGFIETNYSYTWSDGQTTGLATALTAGTYTVTVADDANCSTVLSVDIEGPLPVTGVTELLAPSTCEGANPGQAFVTPNPGSSPFTYLWDNGETNFQAFDLSPGLHTVTIIDANGCTGVESIDVPTTPLPTIDNVSGTPATCSSPNGSIEVFATSSNSTLQYSVDNGFSFQNANLFNGLAAGDYDIVILDEFGCQATLTFTLDGGDNPIADVQIGASACNGATGMLTVSATAGTGPYTYSIDGGTTFQASGLFENLAAGIYDVVVQDSDGCTDTQQVEIESSSIPQIATDIVNATCEEDNGQITFNITDGTAPFTYSIDGGTTFSSVSIFTNLPEGTYNLVVVDNLGCDNTSTVTISNTPLPMLTNTITNAICEEANAAISISVDAGTAPFEYSIDGGTTFGADPNFVDLADGSYDIVVRDSEGCSATESITITNTTNPSPGITALGNDTELCEETSITLETGVFAQYDWSTGSRESSIEVSTDGTYSVIVTDDLGCIGSAEIEITDCDLYGIPNAFSPNGDGLNDEFGIEFRGDVEIVDFQIFNRWGEVVHNGINYWDGRFNGEDQPMDVYIYKVVIRIPGQEDELISGDVTLLR